MRSGQTLRVFTGHTDSVSRCAFSPDGKLALSASSDKTLRLWDVISGQTVQTFTGHTDSVYGWAFSPNGTLALRWSADQTLRLWDVSSGQTVREWHTNAMSRVAFSPDGRVLVSADDTGRVYFWAGTGAGLGELLGVYVATYKIVAIHWLDRDHLLLADDGGPSHAPHFYRLKVAGM